uniref:RING-type domain-containing protein n=1 Tax=Quercus lobata TaxID=97700 RepID=A0A7N2M9F4_QUELO
MENAPSVLLSFEPAPFPASPSSVDLSPLEFVLALIAVVTIPALVYVFFFAVKCPPNPFRGRRYRSSSSETDGISNLDGVADVVKVEKESSHASKDVVGSECPVCLMVFVEGEEVKQLSVCKHSFHVPCIDLWLNSHSNCPVCRASVSVKQGVGKRSMFCFMNSVCFSIPSSPTSCSYSIVV